MFNPELPRDQKIIESRKKAGAEKEFNPDTITNPLNEWEDFLSSPYVKKLEESKKFGFSSQQQEEMKETINKLRDSFSEALQKDHSIIPTNDLAHILGNSITINTGFARRVDKGKYFIPEDEHFIPEKKFLGLNKKGELVSLDELQTDDLEQLQNKRASAYPHKEDKYIIREATPEEIEQTRPLPSLPLKQALDTKNEIELLSYYSKEVAEDEELLKKELGSPVGYLEKYLNYFICDLPTKTVPRLKLIKFFRDLEKREINKENFEERAIELTNFLDINKIKENLL